jgi:phosphate:Na+ symporter
MHSFSIFDIFNLCAGLAIFLYGMQQGEKNLKRIGGADLQKIIAIITRHRLSAYFAGFSLTMVTQSSSATTVMLVGLASAQLMSLGQSLGMILGSDLATTFTVSLFAFKFYQIAPLLIAVGYLISLLSNSNKIGGSGKLLFSLGFIFFGMHMMADSVTPLHSDPLFKNMITASFTNNWYGLLAGTLITATIHSSAATLAIVITLSQSYQDPSGHSLSLVQLFPIVLGANLGTCATALISTLRADLEGTRVAWAHFFFKFLGIIIVFPLAGLIYYAEPFLKVSTAFQIAGLHTIFNIFISILFLPFLYPFEKLILLIIKQNKKKHTRFHTTYLSEKVIGLPVLALSQSIKEISAMGEKVTLMLEKSTTSIAQFNFKTTTDLNDLDDEVDFLYESIVAYISRISRQELDTEQSAQAYGLIMITADIEHIGDTVSKSINSLTQKIDAAHIALSIEGKNEILQFFSETILNFKEVMAAFAINDKSTAEGILSRKIRMRTHFSTLFENHMERLYNGRKESLQTTSVHKDILEEIQRINHFSFRIANAIVRGNKYPKPSDEPFPLTNQAQHAF